jgi:hypothetical protein
MLQRIAPIAIPLSLAVAAFLVSCGEGGAPQVPPGPGVDEDRQAKATELFQDAAVAPVLEKVDLLRKLVARYPETRQVPEAYARLVFYLLHRNCRDPEGAFEALQQFRSRHPDHPEVAYAFGIVDDYERGQEGDVARRARLQEAWRSFLDAWQERNPGADVPTRLPIWISRGELAKRQGRMEEVIDALGEVATWVDAPGVDWDDHQMMLIKNAIVDYGCALGVDPARKEAALEAFRAALDLSESGVRGARAEDIRALVAELEQDGSLTPRPPDPGSAQGR